MYGLRRRRHLTKSQMLLSKHSQERSKDSNDHLLVQYSRLRLHSGDMQNLLHCKPTRHHIVIQCQALIYYL
jgi:hypothetical protein